MINQEVQVTKEDYEAFQAGKLTSEELYARRVKPKQLKVDIVYDLGLYQLNNSKYFTSLVFLAEYVAHQNSLDYRQVLSGLTGLDFSTLGKALPSSFVYS